jgi:hypothetical protein
MSSHISIILPPSSIIYAHSSHDRPSTPHDIASYYYAVSVSSLVIQAAALAASSFHA